MFRSARGAYEVAVKATESSRELEAAALTKAARLLDECRHGWNEPDRANRLEEALRFNQRLWTFFQAELTRPGHEMPRELRVNLLSLSAFVDRRTFELLAEPRAEGLQALVDINRNIALGLKESAARPPASAPPPAPSTRATDRMG